MNFSPFFSSLSVYLSVSLWGVYVTRRRMRMLQLFHPDQSHCQSESEAVSLCVPPPCLSALETSPLSLHRHLERFKIWLVFPVRFTEQEHEELNPECSTRNLGTPEAAERNSKCQQMNMQISPNVITHVLVML